MNNQEYPESGIEIPDLQMPIEPDNKVDNKVNHIEYQIFQEWGSCRKFVRKDKKRWYLDEHRGKYRYTEGDKTKIYIRSM